MVGCTKISPGCDHCYAETVTKRLPNGFPNGFRPTFKPVKLLEPRKYRHAGRVFVNSMSDIHHADFTDAERDAVYDVMLAEPRHDYLVLTKRANMMATYFTGPDGWLARRALDEVPVHIWVGCSIENDQYVFRADKLRGIPAKVRFLSLEPLLGPLPSLDLTGIVWIIIGGESGPGWRPMDLEWARQLRDRADAAGVACFFKQSAGYRTETGITLDGQLLEQFPLEHPGDRRLLDHLPVIGRWTGRHQVVEGSPVAVRGLWDSLPVTSDADADLPPATR